MNFRFMIIVNSNLKKGLQGILAVTPQAFHQFGALWEYNLLIKKTKKPASEYQKPVRAKLKIYFQKV